MFEVEKKTWTLCATATFVIGVCLAAAPSAASIYQPIYSFCSKRDCRDGDNSGLATGSLLMDKSGNLFGVTTDRIFELTYNGSTGAWGYKLLHTFGANGATRKGAGPHSNLIVDNWGNLYGTTQYGGKGDGGIVFELVPGSGDGKWTLQVLHEFCPRGNDCHDGSNPDLAGLAYLGADRGLPYDGASPLYGTTVGGGVHSEGTAYQLTPVANGGKWHEQVIYNFCAQPGAQFQCIDGENPDYGLIMDADGNLYGTAQSGPDNGGVVFELSPKPKKDKWRETLLYWFNQQPNYADGVTPKGAPARDGSGNLYGTTYFGGAHGVGLVYKLTHVNDAWSETVLHSFCEQQECPDGANPTSGPILDASGNLFGTTYYGENGGVVYELNPSFQIVHTFCQLISCVDGGNPTNGVIMDGAGNLFGTTQAGGANHHGAVYKLTP